MSSSLEKLPSELLSAIRDYLRGDLSALKALRRTSQRLRQFDILMEEVNVQVTISSLRKLRNVAANPVLRKQVNKIVIWAPLFYETMTQEHNYAEAVRQQMENDYYSELIEGHKTITFSDTLRATARERSIQSCRDNPEQGLAEYRDYYREQEDILNADFVPQLSAALHEFRILDTVVVKPFKCAGRRWMPEPGRDFRFRIYGTPRGTRWEHSEEYLHQIIEAVATSGRILKTFVAHPWLWRLHRGGLRMSSLPMTRGKLENMTNVFRPLRTLAFGLNNAHNLVVESELNRRFDEVLHLAPSLEDITLSMDRKEHRRLLANQTWSKLRAISLKDVYMSGEDLRLFLYRHRMTLKKIKIRSVYLVDESWRPNLELLREMKAQSLIHLKVRVLRVRWQDYPFHSGDDEDVAVEKFLNGAGDWTDELEEALGYEDPSGFSE
ncbi:MAG: hypothetical protein M1836_002659 [Candelina mexicana]|nr:MAG: hypothetical protein M1836_002659 [Candelina mexicana]